ncbi:MAG: Rrf2 family transcriptional regulator [Candidatus Sumerlaeota bacterium]|nr:Rrf2 family transcriptional regulator [Candidatus Sumerlaeota bacterium]
MSSLIKISEGAALALHACALLAAKPEESFPVAQLAERLQGSSAHLAKVMQRLTKAGIVAGTRGPKGGFVLARSAREISLLDVFEAIEGTFAPTHCAFDNPVCGRHHCLLGGFIGKTDQKFLGYIKNTKLSDVVEKR